MIHLFYIKGIPARYTWYEVLRYKEFDSQEKIDKFIEKEKITRYIVGDGNLVIKEENGLGEYEKWDKKFKETKLDLA